MTSLTITARDFYKREGSTQVKAYITNAPPWAKAVSASRIFVFYSRDADNPHFIPLTELKALVKSHKRVAGLGGLDHARAHLNDLADRCCYGGLIATRKRYESLRRAIADYEACY